MRTLPLTAGGVPGFDIVDLFGGAANGTAGGVVFGTNDNRADETRSIFFVQTLGTSGTGCPSSSG